MAVNKSRKKIIEADKQRILELIRAESEGMVSKTLVEITDFDRGYIQRLLISLRNDGYIFSKEINLNRSCRTQLWSSYPFPTTESNEEKPYLDFDENHREWLKKVTEKKSLYNPWGKV